MSALDFTRAACAVCGPGAVFWLTNFESGKEANHVEVGYFNF